MVGANADPQIRTLADQHKKGPITTLQPQTWAVQGKTTWSGRTQKKTGGVRRAREASGNATFPYLQRKKQVLPECVWETFLDRVLAGIGVPPRCLVYNNARLRMYGLGPGPGGCVVRALLRVQRLFLRNHFRRPFLFEGSWGITQVYWRFVFAMAFEKPPDVVVLGRTYTPLRKNAKQVISHAAP